MNFIYLDTSSMSVQIELNYTNFEVEIV